MELHTHGLAFTLALLFVPFLSQPFLSVDFSLSHSRSPAFLHSRSLALLISIILHHKLKQGREEEVDQSYSHRLTKKKKEKKRKQKIKKNIKDKRREIKGNFVNLFENYVRRYKKSKVLKSRAKLILRLKKWDNCIKSLFYLKA